jgi:hypothetical protein
MRHARRTLLRLSLSLAVAGASTAAVAGCHSARRAEQISPNAAATLQVQNNGFADMTIYVLRGSQRIRLGLSTGNSTQLFRIPADVITGAGTLRFLADPVGGRRAPVSDEISVRPGDTVTLMIPPS